MKKYLQGIFVLASGILMILIAATALDANAMNEIKMEAERYSNFDMKFVASMMFYFISGSFLFGFVYSKLNKQ